MNQLNEFVCKLRHPRAVRRIWGELKGEIIKLLVLYVLSAFVRYGIGVRIMYHDFEASMPLFFFSYLIPTFYTAKVLISVLTFFAKNREKNREFIGVKEIVLGQVQADSGALHFTFLSNHPRLENLGWGDSYDPMELTVHYTPATIRRLSTSCVDGTYGRKISIQGCPEIAVKKKEGSMTQTLSPSSLRYKWFLHFSNELRLFVENETWDNIKPVLDGIMQGANQQARSNGDIKQLQGDD